MDKNKYLKLIEQAHNLVCLHIALMEDNLSPLVQDNVKGLKARAKYLEREYFKISQH